jgi:hypothetical protein
MSAKTIYVVIGSTGEYSDRTEWLVIAFDSEDRAKQHVLSATARARELEQWVDADDEPWRYSEAKDKPTNEYDPEMKMQSMGTSYYYAPSLLMLSPRSRKAGR